VYSSIHLIHTDIGMHKLGNKFLNIIHILAY